MAFVEQREPIWLKKNDWFSSFQLYDALVVNHNKRYMITKRVQDIPLSKIVGVPGSPGLTNGIQAQYEDVNNGVIPYDKTWTNARAYNFDDSVDNLALSVFYGNRHPSIVFAQLMEDSNIHGSSNPDQASRYAKCEAILARVAQLLLENDGVSVENNWIIADYFCGIYGWATNAQMDDIGYLTAVAQVQSVAEARKTNRNNEGVYTTNNYEQYGGYNYRHRILPGYIEGLGTQFQGRGLYSAVYNIERNYIQRNNRKCICYANGTVEGLTLPGTDRSGVWQRFPVRDAGGDLIRLSSIEGNYDLLKAYALIHLLMTEGYVIWDDNGKFGLNDKRFDVAYYGGAEPWKNKWQPDGGPITQYQPGAPGHPISQNTGGQFAGNPASHNNGSWAGNYIYGQIWDRTTTSLKWATFNYNENGNQRSGYYNGDTPEMGVLGTGEVSRYGVSNYASANAARQFYEGMRPMLWKGTGPAGSVYVGLNIHAGFAGTTTYNTPDGSFTHKGNGIFAFKIQ